MMLKFNLKKFFDVCSILKKCSKSVHISRRGTLPYTLAKFGTPQKSVILPKNLPYSISINDTKFQFAKMLGSI